MNFNNERYERLKTIFQGKRLLSAFLGLDAFDSNADYVASCVEGTGKTVRL